MWIYTTLYVRNSRARGVECDGISGGNRRTMWHHGVLPSMSSARSGRSQQSRKLPANQTFYIFARFRRDAHEMTYIMHFAYLSFILITIYNGILLYDEILCEYTVVKVLLYYNLEQF